MTALSVLLPLLLACIVLQPNEIDRRNSPPFVRSPENATIRLDRIVTVNVDQLGSTADIEFPFVAGDPDGDSIEGRVFFDYLPTQPRGYISRISLPSGGATFENQFRIPRSEFVAGRCHRVELLLTHQFADPIDGGAAGERRVAREGDLTTAVWWVQVLNASNLNVLMSGCP